MTLVEGVYRHSAKLPDAERLGFLDADDLLNDLVNRVFPKLSALISSIAKREPKT